MDSTKQRQEAEARAMFNIPDDATEAKIQPFKTNLMVMGVVMAIIAMIGLLDATLLGR